MNNNIIKLNLIVIPFLQIAILQFSLPRNLLTDTLKLFNLCQLICARINLTLCEFWQEDFQSMTYGFKLAHNVTDLRVAGMLREVEEEFNRRIKVS